jgi:hypothetical protein
VRFSPFPPLHRSRGTGDRKKLRRALQQAFGASEEALDALLPPKGSLSVSKVSPPSRASVYSSDGVPLLVDLSGKGDFLPSLFALWRAPNLLPQLALRHADVAAFLMGGADLMLPGAAQPLPPDLRVGQLRRPRTQTGRLSSSPASPPPAPLRTRKRTQSAAAHPQEMSYLAAFTSFGLAANSMVRTEPHGLNLLLLTRTYRTPQGPLLPRLAEMIGSDGPASLSPVGARDGSAVPRASVARDAKASLAGSRSR